MKILGIDPGTATVGFGIIESTGRLGRTARLVECGVVRMRAGDTLPRRLAQIHAGMGELLERHRPDALAVEDIFYGPNVRTTVVLGHARGVILLAAEEAGVPVTSYAPRVVKKTVVGAGGALKAQVGYMVARLLQLQAPPKPADAADAVAVALTHLLRPVRAAPASGGLRR
ncbi:MAG: crossover junction endodeoxyribonuclease RuvC [Gemmatimonadales bacterium]